MRLGDTHDIFERFRCKSCEGHGMVPGPRGQVICDACNCEGYTITEPQRRSWEDLMRRVRLNVDRYRRSQMTQAISTFDKQYPPGNPLCQAHPNVRTALLNVKSTVPVDTWVFKGFIRTILGLPKNAVSTAISGLRNWISRKVRSLRKTTPTPVSDPKTPRRIVEGTAADAL